MIHHDHQRELELLQQQSLVERQPDGQGKVAQDQQQRHHDRIREALLLAELTPDGSGATIPNLVVTSSAAPLQPSHLSLTFQFDLLILGFVIDGLFDAFILDVGHSSNTNRSLDC